MAVVAQLLKEGISALAEAFERESATRDAEVLLQGALGWSRAQLISRRNCEISEVESQCFLGFISRRLSFEPVAYILGEREFYSNTFQVNSSVLIPRPETELVVDRAVGLLRRAAERFRSALVIDVGTGSGAILVSLLKEFSEFPGRGMLTSNFALQAIGIDISREALGVAELNAQRILPNKDIRWLQGDLLRPVLSELQSMSKDCFLLIVSNPPYIGEREELMPDVCRFEPHQALYGGGIDGLEVPRELLAQSLPLISECGGALVMELGQGQTDRILSEPLMEALLKEAAVARLPDAAGIERVLEIVFWGKSNGT